MHLSETQINDFADNALTSDERATIDQHLAGCAQCRADVAAVQGLLQRVGALPASAQPERDLRPGIWTQIDALQPSKIGSHRAGAHSPHTTLWHWRYPLAAAAVLLIAISSIVTVLLTRDADGPVVRATPPATNTVDLVSLERRYSTEVAELQATLRKNRAQLAPETVQILEDNLRIIDNAIQEARTALANDPQSAMLGELLRSAYQQKLDLLKQVARSSAET